jgi:hypothetical protein
LAEKVPQPRVQIALRKAASIRPVYGFKVKIYQLSDVQNIDPGEFLRDLATIGTRIIYLSRRNLLRHVLSNCVAREYGYHFRQGDRVHISPMRLEPSALLEMMNKRAKHGRNEAAALGQLAAHRIVYENDLLSQLRQQRCLTECFRFLDVPPQRVDTDLVRGVTGPLPSLITNYDEVVAALRDTEYECFLNDTAYD